MFGFLKKWFGKKKLNPKVVEKKMLEAIQKINKRLEPEERYLILKKVTQDADGKIYLTIKGDGKTMEKLRRMLENEKQRGGVFQEGDSVYGFRDDSENHF